MKNCVKSYLLNGVAIRFNVIIMTCFMCLLCSCASQPDQISPQELAAVRATRDADRAERAAKEAADSESKATASSIKAELALSKVMAALSRIGAEAKRAEEAAARAESCMKKACEPSSGKPGDEPGVVRLHVKADPQLNYYQGSSHTLLLCVYHLKEPGVFNQLVDEKDGLSKLLECNRFDPSVAKSGVMIIQPGQEKTDTLARVEGANYVGIIAGYYNNFKKERIVRFFRLPLVEEKIGTAVVQRMGTLYVDLYLGPQEMVELRGKQ